MFNIIQGVKPGSPYLYRCNNCKKTFIVSEKKTYRIWFIKKYKCPHCGSSDTEDSHMIAK